MADNGSFFLDTREPFVATPPGAVTLAATAKALYTTSQFPVLGGQYWARVGKKMRIKLTGIITTAVTPGNGSFAVFYGSGADNTGVSLATSTATALTASQTNLLWTAELTVECITIGNTGTLRCTGWAMFNEAVLVAHQMISLAAGAASAACDLTAANIISVQYLRSGSTAETMQVLSMDVVAMN
jgi:hypothetical protein